MAQDVFPMMHTLGPSFKTSKTLIVGHSKLKLLIFSEVIVNVNYYIPFTPSNSDVLGSFPSNIDEARLTRDSKSSTHNVNYKRIEEVWLYIY